MKDKYLLYEASVQNPESDIDFILKEYSQEYGRSPTRLREDFCGTGMLLAEWVRRGEKNMGTGIDLSSEPIESGRARHWAALSSDQQKRMKYVEADVLSSSKYKAEVICAFNYSFYIFKQRSMLLKYFKAVRSSLAKDGLFFLDCFGGTEAMMEGEESRDLDTHKYYWDCEKFNPITHDCFYSIHFKPKGQKKQKRVFTYEWRFWTLPELKDLLEEAGFSKVFRYWEGDDNEGGGDGEFARTNVAENCLSWISYIVAKP